MLDITPKDIYKEISKEVIGQHDAKVVMSVNLFLHLVRYYTALCPFKMKKPVTLLCGESGSGKTFLTKVGCQAIRTLMMSRFDDDPAAHRMFPVCEIDCTSIVRDSYKGMSIRECIESFVREEADTCPREFENDLHRIIGYSILYFDEIDKICSSGTTDFVRELQYTLLKVLEGHTITYEIERRTAYRSVDLSNMMIVLSGNFPEMRQKRKDNKTKLFGFTGEVNDKPVDIITELQETGMATQLCGRISSIVELQSLTEQELCTIIIKNRLPGLESLFYALTGDKRILTQFEITEIAQQTLDLKVGARGLDSLIYRKIQQKLFDIDKEDYHAQFDIGL